MSYSLHNLKVIGMDLEGILDCQVESRIGEHSRLTLLACADREEEFLYEFPVYPPVQVMLQEGDREECLFSGVVTDVRITVQAQVKLVQIEGKSVSWLMDRTRRSRSFQDAGMSFHALAEKVLGDYPGSVLYYAAPEQAIGSLLVQYEETDWEFLKRAMSLIGAEVTPDSRRPGLCLYAGVPSLPEAEAAFRIQRMEKDMQSCYHLRANGRSVQAADFTRYEVSGGSVLGIFESVRIRGHALTVRACRYTFEGQELVCTYSLQKAGGLTRAAAYPMHLIGTALPGKVERTSGSKVQVAMEIDRTSGNPALHWFPYSTLSASADGSGWYCMPEIGDQVRICFPSKYEKEAIALSAVNSYDAPSGGGEDRMQDPDSRYLKTKSGQELALAPGRMKLSCGKGRSAVTIQNDGKILIEAQNMVQAEAGTELVVQAGEELVLHAKEGLVVQSSQGGGIAFDGAKVVIQGTEVKFD